VGDEARTCDRGMVVHSRVCALVTLTGTVHWVCVCVWHQLGN